MSYHNFINLVRTVFNMSYHNFINLVAATDKGQRGK